MSDFISENEFKVKGEKTMDFNEMIGSNAKKKAPAKKAKKSAEIVSVPEDVQEEIDNLIKAKKDKKIADSNIKKSEPKIIDHGIRLKDEKAYSGKFQKSYKLGTDESHVNFVTANKWSFNEDDVKDIKEILGDKADKMILEETEVKLKADVFKNEELKKRFVEMVGAEFPEFFETVISHHVSSDFDSEVYDADIDLEDLKMLMKQSKPSLR